MTRRIACGLAMAALAGCGTEPSAAPDPLQVREPGRFVERRDPRTGLRFEAPVNWIKRLRERPGIFRLASGGADVSGWAYPRIEKLPQTDAELSAAREALVAYAKQRNPTFAETSSRVTAVKGWPAVELRGTQEILGNRVTTRSVHVYRAGEYVFEALAPARDFPVANREVLEPLLRSLVFRPLPPS